VSGQIQYGPAENPTSLQTAPNVPAGVDEDHFTIPVRFGRRKTDQVGHLVLTTAALNFRGTVDMSVLWTQVARIDRADTELVIALYETRRILRFCCFGEEEAARASAIGNHLVGLAQSQPLHETV
jgi:hypothetical protein